MAFESVSSSGGEGLFPQHPRSGNWETLKGSMLAPHLQTPLESSNQATNLGGNNKVAPPMPWESSIKPSEGLTRGGGTMAH